MMEVRRKVEMKKQGFFGIGCYQLKTKENYGTLFRTAQIYGADFIFLIGSKFKAQSTDTMKSWRHIPVYEYKDFIEFIQNKPLNSKLIGVEIEKDSIPLHQYKHPKQACYLLGSESTGLPNNIIEACDEIVVLPGERSLNVSVAGSIVIYDRIMKY